MSDTIYAQVEDVLDGLALPYGQDSYLCKGALPDAYLTWSLISDPPVQHADDALVSTTPRIQVSYWDRDGFGAMPDIRTAFESAGFSYVNQRGLPRDDEAGHFGLAIDFSLLMEV